MRHIIFPKVFFDANSFCPPQDDEKKAMSEIEKMIDQIENVMIEIPYSVKKEVSLAPKWIRTKITQTIYTLPVTLTDKEIRIKEEIQILLFGNQVNLSQNQVNDIIHIFEAQKYGCRFFVTLDKKHILSKGVEIEKRFILKVVNPTEYLHILKIFFS